MNTTKERKYYKDVTQKWLKNAMPNSCNVIDSRYFRDTKGNKYYVDGKKVILDYSIREKEIAEWLVNIFGGKIYMLPRINSRRC